MKTILLRSLLREPVKVKHLTRAGQSVQVTDNGKPLWVIRPAAQEQEDAERARAIDALLDEALRAPRSRISPSEIWKRIAGEDIT
jgi:antitoxin (DNA-binding transcriptional repressor) of toxin-antitoxin stability system